jgi:hypothetical protein
VWDQVRKAQEEDGGKFEMPKIEKMKAADSVKRATY